MLAEAERPRAWLQHLLPLLVAAACCLAVALTIADYGICWDERFYYWAGLANAAWLRHPSLANVDAAFSFALHQHPPLAPLLGGVARYLLHKRLGLMGPLTAFRWRNLVFALALFYSLFCFVRDAWGWKVGLLSSLFVLVLPRLFVESHLATVDYAVAAMSVAVAWAFWRGLANTRWMAFAAGLMGLALLTKINAVFLHALILCWFVARFRQRLFAPGAEARIGGRREREALLLRLVMLAAIPWVVFVLGWPWLWVDPVRRIPKYFITHLAHRPVPVHYLGQTYIEPPWHYPFVLTVVTIPLLLLLCLAVALVRLRRLPNCSAAVFLLANALAPLAVIAFLTPCKYDGVRLFLAAFPFLGALAALGAAELFRLARRIRVHVLFAVLFVLLFIVSVWRSVVAYHPYQLAYYNELVGGAKGAAARGFEADYWGSSFRGLLPWLRTHPGARLHVPAGDEVLKFYAELGILAPPTLTLREQADYLVLLSRQGWWDGECWHYAREKKPIVAVSVAGATLAAIYELDNPGRRRVPDAELWRPHP